MNCRQISKPTRRRLLGVYMRWLFGSAWCWNYETMQAGGMVLAFAPFLRKKWDQSQDQKERLLTYYEPYNSHRKLSNYVLGALLALEEQRAPRQQISLFKSALMGPLGGIGDSLLHTVPMMTFGAIAAMYALSQSALGVIPGVLFGVLLQIGSFWLLMNGYRNGESGVFALSQKAQLLASGVRIFSIVFLGGLLGTVPEQFFPSGSVQPLLPGAGGLASAALFYVFLGWKKATTGRCMLLLLMLSGAVYYCGI